MRSRTLTTLASFSFLTLAACAGTVDGPYNKAGSDAALEHPDARWVLQDSRTPDSLSADTLSADTLSADTLSPDMTPAPCKKGYERDSAGQCVDIDECKNSPCKATETCQNTAGSYTCTPIPCPTGYQRDAAGNCVDIDECKGSPCPAGQTCTNTPGSYSCKADPTTWDYALNQPCAPGTWNCDCHSSCGSTSACAPNSCGSTGTWPDPACKEIAKYHGRTNGNRPTWYFSKKMAQYPQTFTIVINGCPGLTVTSNNGVRFEKNGIIVKQSDVAGRGMAVVVPSSCQSTQCCYK